MMKKCKNIIVEFGALVMEHSQGCKRTELLASYSKLGSKKNSFRARVSINQAELELFMMLGSLGSRISLNSLIIKHVCGHVHEFVIRAYSQAS